MGKVALPTDTLLERGRWISLNKSPALPPRPGLETKGYGLVANPEDLILQMNDAQIDVWEKILNEWREANESAYFAMLVKIKAERARRAEFLAETNA